MQRAEKMCATDDTRESERAEYQTNQFSSLIHCLYQEIAKGDLSSRLPTSTICISFQYFTVGMRHPVYRCIATKINNFDMLVMAVSANSYSKLRFSLDGAAVCRANTLARTFPLKRLHFKCCQGK